MEKIVHRWTSSTALAVVALCLLGAPLLGWVEPAVAADPQSVDITIKDHRFEPSEVQVPADVKLKLVIHNTDTTPEEFESHTLHREKVVPGGGEITVFVGPLDPGTYDFFGDFNPKTAQGHITAK